MRIGIYGGTFDPVHYGHLLFAESAREQCRLDQVWFMPAAVSPHKQGQTGTPATHRIEMLKLATSGQRPFEVRLREVERGGVSYTVETLQEIAADEPESELFLLLGADSLVDLPNWRSPVEICELATLIVVRRPGSELDFDCLSEFVGAQRLANFKAHQVTMPPIGISSTDLRERVAAGRSVRFQTPRAVEKYIETHGVYQAD